MLILSSSGYNRSSAIRPERVGRDGFLRLSFERRGAGTVLTERRFTLPLQALAPTSLDGNGSACLMLLNPTGGIVGGDHLKTEIMLGDDTHAILTTPSATKVYRALEDPAVHETRIQLGEGAFLEYLPDHVIPHPGSAFHQSLSLEMAPGCRVILFDALSFGRLARGEQWNFRELMNQTIITMERQPIFLDRVRLAPEVWTPAGLGGVEGFGYLATFVLCADAHEDWEDLARALLERLDKTPSVSGGISPLSRGGYVMRFLAPSAYDLTQVAQDLWSIARQGLLGLPALDLRKC